MYSSRTPLDVAKFLNCRLSSLSGLFPDVRLNESYTVQMFVQENSSTWPYGLDTQLILACLSWWHYIHPKPHSWSLQLNIRTFAQRHTPTPTSIRLASSTLWSTQYIVCSTSVGHYRVVGCTGETALTMCWSTRITTVNTWMWIYRIDTE